MEKNFLEKKKKKPKRKARRRPGWEPKGPEFLAQFDSVGEFKNFLNQSKENIIVFQGQIREKQKVKKTNEGLLRGGQLKETNTAIDKDIQEIQNKESVLQNGLDKYSEATEILDLIKQKQKVKKTNEGLLRGGQLKETNAAIDKDIAELNQELEEMVVKKAADKAKSTDTGVHKEREKSSEEKLIEEIQEALKSKDDVKIADITRKIYEMEKGKGANLLDFKNPSEMKKYLQEKLEELQNEEQSETVTTAKFEEFKEVSLKKKTKKDKQAMTDKEMLYKTKIDLREDISEEEKTKLKEKVNFVNKENIKETCEKEIKNLITLSYDKEDKAKNEEYESKIDALSEQMGLPLEEIQNIIDTQKIKLEGLVYQQEKKKESKWKKFKRMLPKIALYGGGAVLGILTGGTFALAIGAGMGTFRIAETILKGKKSRKDQEAAIQKSRQILLGEIDETNMSETDKKDKDDAIQSFYDDIFVRLSVQKQNQIDGSNKEHTAIGQEINKLENAYDPKDPESKEKLEELYKQRRVAHKTQIKKYLEAQGVSGKELENRVKLSTQLVELEDNQSIMELDFTKRKVGKVSKIFSKLDKILSHPALLGGAKGAENQTKEKLITASIFAVAGVLARACPIVRNILLAYAGMKLGSAAANLFVSKENKELLKEISAENISSESSMDDISKAKAQLVDPKFKKANPIEHAKLQEKIFAIDRAKMEKALGTSEGDEDGGYIGETNKKLEETIKKKRVAKGAHKGMKIFLGVAGGVAGWLVGEYMNEQSKIKAEEKTQQDAARITEETEEKVAKEENLLVIAEKKVEQELAKKQAEFAEKQAALAELNKEVIVEKGDTSWSMAEDGCEKRIEGWDDFRQAEKDYIIDSYKDKMVADPDSIGIDGGDASSLKIGDKIDIAKIFSDQNEMTKVISEAKGLSPEAIDNIIANREIIGDVMTQKLENVSGDNLIKAMNIMGGSEQSGAGFVQEFNERATEIMGANITPEQTQMILDNPDVFGKIMNAGSDLGKADNNTLAESLRLLNDTESVGNGFVDEVAKIESPLADEFSKRANDVLHNIKDKFGDIFHAEHDDSGIASIYDTDPLAVQTEEALENSKNLIDQGEKIQELIGKSDSAWHKFWGINGKIDRLQQSFNESVNKYQGSMKEYNFFLKDGQSYGKSWFELTGDKGLLQNYFQSDYLKNNEIKIENNISTLSKIIKGIQKHFVPK